MAGCCSLRRPSLPIRLTGSGRRSCIRSLTGPTGRALVLTPIALHEAREREALRDAVTRLREEHIVRVEQVRNHLVRSATVRQERTAIQQRIVKRRLSR